MKTWKDYLLLGAIIVVLFLTSAHLFMAFMAKPLITSSLQDITKKKVTIGNLDLKFPLGLKLRNVNIEGLAKIDYLYLSPSLLGFLTGNIAFNEIRLVRPKLFLEKNQPVAKENNKVVQEPAPAETKKHVHLFFKEISISDGTIEFTDQTVTPGGIKIKLKDINLDIDNLYLLPVSVVANFQLKAKIPWQRDVQEGSVDINGWLNLYKRDMQASIKIKDIDGVYLHPYYSNWVDLEKARIQQAKLNFRSDITGHNNDIVAECHLELTDIVFRPKEEEEPEARAHKIATAVIDLFKAFNNKIDLNFTIKTKMDQPQFGFESIRTAVEDKIARTNKHDTVDTLFSIPTKLIENTVKGAVDITKALISGTLAVGGELKKGTEEIFKEEKKEPAK